MSSPFTAEQQRQYQALTAGVGIAENSDQTFIELTGADRAKFLQNFCTNHVAKLSPGQGCEAFLCNVQGKILGHVVILCEQESLTLMTSPGQAERLLAHLDKYLITEDVELHDRTDDWGQIILAGICAEELVARIVEAIPAHPWEHVTGNINRLPVVVYRTAAFGDKAFAIRCEKAEVQTIMQYLVSQAATVCNPEVVESVRIESGFPIYGVDITDSNLPQEIRRDERTIDFKKGCYLGQETVARIDALGHVNWHLVRVKFNGDACPGPGAEFKEGDRRVGRVTSCARSPKFNSPLGFAFIRRELANAGTQLVGEGISAEVVG